MWYKNNVAVKKPKSLILNGMTYVPPTDEQLIEAGYVWKEDKIYEPTYEELVESLIRKKYSISNEFAILRQRDSKPEEFEVYNQYCEECKKQVKDEMSCVED